MYTRSTPAASLSHWIVIHHNHSPIRLQIWNSMILDSWYSWCFFSKTLAEREAFYYVVDNAAVMDFITVNTSGSILINMLKWNIFEYFIDYSGSCWRISWIGCKDNNFVTTLFRWGAEYYIKVDVDLHVNLYVCEMLPSDLTSYPPSFKSYFSYLNLTYSDISFALNFC